MAIYDASKEIQAELDGQHQVRPFHEVENAVEHYYMMIAKKNSISSLSAEPRGGYCTPDPRVREQRQRTFSSLSVCFTVGLLGDDERRDLLVQSEADALSVIDGEHRPSWVVSDELDMSPQRFSFYLERIMSVLRRRMNRRGLLRHGNYRGAA